MFSDGVISLIEEGIINNKCKKLNPGLSVTAFISGTRKLYDFVDDNPEVRVMDISYVNDTSIIRQNPKVTAINSAVEVDLTGQVCADSIEVHQYSGIGNELFLSAPGMNFQMGHSHSCDPCSEKKHVLMVSGSFGRSPFSYTIKHSFSGQVIHGHKVPLFIAHG